MFDEPLQHSPVDLDLLDVQSWHTVYWAEIERRIGSLFARSEASARAMAYLAALLSPAERKNSWQLAEISGNPNPYAFQHLLGRADWDPDTLRDRLRSYMTTYLVDDHAIGVLDETGFLKKGIHSAGVARQYSGTAGKIENCQIGVFLAYASTLGHSLLDRELYLPQEWIDDRERCRRAGIPDERAFATKPALALQMLQRNVEAGLKLAWVTGDSIYGDDRALRQWLESHHQPFVLAVSGKEAVWLDSHQRQIKLILAELPVDGWERLSAGAGSKGLRWYDWRRLELSEPPERDWKRWLLIRRSISDPSELTGYIAFARAGTSLVEMVRVAGTRWTVEESIQTAKGEVGLDHYEVRSWTGWYRHITLAMWASAFLSVIRSQSGAELAPKKGMRKQIERSSLAAFKASRGLQSD
jgi:SRSO17 transposase